MIADFVVHRKVSEKEVKKQISQNKDKIDNFINQVEKIEKSSMKKRSRSNDNINQTNNNTEPRKSLRLKEKLEQKRTEHNMGRIVYKACKNSIATLELCSDSVTNESRKDLVNSDYAKFRTNKAKVISLINPTSGKHLMSDVSRYYIIDDEPLSYVVGEYVETSFNPNIDVVCSSGIHYFKTYDAALSWYLQYHLDERKNGTFVMYYDNGAKHITIPYKNGKVDGKKVSYYKNGIKSSEINYKNGKKSGSEIDYNEYGTICRSSNNK